MKVPLAGSTIGLLWHDNCQGPLSQKRAILVLPPSSTARAVELGTHLGGWRTLPAPWSSQTLAAQTGSNKAHALNPHHFVVSMAHPALPTTRFDVVVVVAVAVTRRTLLRIWPAFPRDCWPFLFLQYQKLAFRRVFEYLHHSSHTTWHSSAHWSL